jgi:3-dehydroquinate synthase
VQYGLEALHTYLNTTNNQIIALVDKHTLQDCYPKIQTDIPFIQVPYGEGYKNLNSCEYIWKHLTELKATRKSILLCVGGGVLCDMGSLAGVLYQRGMRVVLCPTSLLAMVDAAIGGKNGVNFLGFKNYVGTFHQAEETFICTDFLETLPNKELVNGYVEMLKHGLIADKSHYDAVKMFFLSNSKHVTEELIKHSIALKLQHTQQDFKDKGIRQRLNFGHTIGHAIESWSLSIQEENKELSHGYSVALGIIAESFISKRLTGLSENDFNEITVVLQGFVKGLDHPLPRYRDIQGYLIADKKNVGEGVRFALLHNIGECTENHLVNEDVIADAMDYLHYLK